MVYVCAHATFFEDTVDEIGVRYKNSRTSDHDGYHAEMQIAHTASGSK